MQKTGRLLPVITALFVTSLLTQQRNSRPDRGGQYGCPRSELSESQRFRRSAYRHHARVPV